MYRLIYGLLTLLFGAFVLFLPETKNLPLPRTILQVIFENLLFLIPILKFLFLRLRRCRHRLVKSFVLVK